MFGLVYTPNFCTFSQLILHTYLYLLILVLINVSNLKVEGFQCEKEQEAVRAASTVIEDAVQSLLLATLC